MTEKTVIAIVLTFNGHARLRRGLPALHAQSRRPDRTIVVDNCSTDAATVALLDVEAAAGRIEVLRLSHNGGPAGGFADGIASVLGDGSATHLWLLDDDSRPTPDCLKTLLEELGDDQRRVQWPQQLTERGDETFVETWRGPLLPIAVVRAAGVPDATYFWGLEDTEFFNWRIAHKGGVERRFSRRAQLHYDQDNVRKRKSWHYYYISRNRIFFKFREQEASIFDRLALNQVISIVKMAGIVALREDHKLLKLRRLAAGVRDGILGRMGKRVEVGGP